MARIRIAVATFAAALLLLAAIGPATGYIEQHYSQVLLSAPNVVKCDRVATIEARVVVTETGEPVQKQIVEWSLAESPSPDDRLSAASTLTDKQGQTSVELTFGPAEGARVVQASIAGVSPTITVRCTGGLPLTSTAPPPGYVEQPPAVASASPAESLPATTLRLDRLGIDLPLVEGDGVGVPEGYASHYPGTAWPREGGNTYLYGHAREGSFLELWKVRTGDRVEVDLADGGVATYEVTEIHPLVPADALEYLAPSPTERLTLQTCLDYAPTAPRFVVIAERTFTSS